MSAIFGATAPNLRIGRVVALLAASKVAASVFSSPTVVRRQAGVVIALSANHFVLRDWPLRVSWANLLRPISCLV